MKVNIGGILKVLVLLLLVIALILGGLLWLDFLGLINSRDALNPVVRLIRPSIAKPTDNPGDLYLLDKERLLKWEESLNIREASLEERSNEVSLKQAELEELTGQLMDRQKEVEEKENSLNAALKNYDDKAKNLEQNARYLEGMPPESAVAIMLQMKDTELVDLLRTSEKLAGQEGRDSLVAFWLSLMPPERSAVVQSKMALKPEE